MFKRNIKELYDSEMNLHDKKMDTEHCVTTLDILKKEIQFLRISVDDCQQTVTQTDNYLEKYMPIKVQNFITETLTNILPKRALQKLNDYMGHKYRVLKEAVERDDGIPNLNKVECTIPILKKIELMVQRSIHN